MGNAESFKIIAGDQLATRHVGFVVPAHGDILLAVGNDGLKDLVLVAQVAIHGIGEVVQVVSAVRIEVAGGIDSPAQAYQLLGMADR